MFLTAKEVCDYVLKKYHVNYTVKGMTSLLHTSGFRYKKPKHIPGKADIEAQLDFIKTYDKLKKKKKEDDRIYFMDGVHPLNNSQPAYGWIKKGTDTVIPSNTGRQRLNLNRTYNLEGMMYKLPLGLIYVILDNSRYYRSQLVKTFVKKNKRIKLMFSPPYSPNINIIERLWKFFKKNVTCNTY